MNWNKKLIALVAAVVLLSLSGVKAEASAAENTPSYYTENVYSGSYGPVEKIYHFYLGAEGVTVEETGAFYTFVGDSVVVDLDIFLLRNELNIDDYYSAYDYLTAEIIPNVSCDFTYTDYGNGLTTIQQQLISATPYVTINGVKHYLSNKYSNSYMLDQVTTDTGMIYGCELEFKIDYTGLGINESAPIHNYGYSTLALTLNDVSVSVHGVRYISTGEDAISDRLDTVHGDFLTLDNHLTYWLNAVDTSVRQWVSSVYDELTGVHKTIKDIYHEFLHDFQLKFETISSQITSIEEYLGNGFNTADSDDVLTDVDNTLSDIDTSETEFGKGAVENLGSFTIPADGFTGYGQEFINAMSLCSSMLQSIFVSAGNFNVVIAVTFTLIICSMVLGLFRFVR